MEIGPAQWAGPEDVRDGGARSPLAVKACPVAMADGVRRAGARLAQGTASKVATRTMKASSKGRTIAR